MNTENTPSLIELEAVIERGKSAYIEVGSALAEIKRRGLYKERGHVTFKEYRRARYPMMKPISCPEERDGSS
ncbi:MAG TPA: hypothetical protein VHT28_14570 [Silvibacterium sp.]|nr:hypothetical protein [Silvibacterium sp.]